MTIWIPIALAAFPLGTLLGTVAADGNDDELHAITLGLSIMSTIAALVLFGYWAGVR